MDITDRITGPLADDLEIVRSVANDLEVPVWLVGGPVRDALLGTTVTDLDFSVEERVEELATVVAERVGGSTRAHPTFMTAKVIHPGGRTIDFITTRTETYPRPGALPVVRPASAEEDLLRRDFTINSIAWDLHRSELLDPAGGLEDLDLRQIRTLHGGSFVDDPTRIIRALRFATRLGFGLEPDTARQLHEAVGSGVLGTVSPQRIWREVTFCVSEPDPAAAMISLLRHEVIQSWLGSGICDPDLEGRLNLLRDLCRDLQDVDEEVLYLATLIAGTDGAAVPGGLGFSRRRHELLERLLVGGEASFERWSMLATDADRGRFCLDLKQEEMIFLALRLDRPGAMMATCLAVRAESLPFGGDDLGVRPGPHVGRALEDARIESWLRQVPPDELLAFARSAALRYLNDDRS